MKTYDKWIEALTIFKKYEHIQQMSAEHDIVYLGPDPEVVSEEDIERLDTLGFYPEEEYDCFYFFT